MDGDLEIGRIGGTGISGGSEEGGRVDLSFGGAKSKVGRLVTTLKNKVLICVLERKMSDLNEDLNARSKFLHIHIC